MKKIIVSFAVLLCTVAMYAQAPQKPHGGHNKHNYSQMVERMESEKIAYLTQKLSLTPDEAKAFWPVYEMIKADKKAQQKALRSAHKDLAASMKPEAGKSEKEIAAATKAYVGLLEKSVNVDAKYYKELCKALPADKVAKYYMAEEGFRQAQINRMRGKFVSL